MTMDVFAIIGWLFLILACAGTAYAMAAAILVPRFVDRRTPDAAPGSGGFPAVTIFKPLSGAEVGLLDHLATFCRQDYPGEIQIVFGIQDARDPAIRAVEEIKRTFHDLDIALVLDAPICGSNLKVANLVNMAHAAKHDILILADSDIAVGRNYIRTVVACLGESRVGTVTCLYRGQAMDGLWSRLAAMGIDHHFLPSVVIGLHLGLALPCFGSTIALQRAVLARTGGFERFSNCLADDNEIGKAVRHLGYRVAIPPMIVAHACAERSFRELVEHELRWARTIFTVDRLGFLGSGLTHALPLALLGATVLGFPPLSLVTVIIAAAARLWLTVRIDAAIAAEARLRPLFVVRDLLSFFVYIAAFFVRSVTWRDRRFRVGPERTITPAEEH